MNTAFVTRTTALALAAAVTYGLLGSVDRLAYEQHAAVQMAKAASAAAATAQARTAPAKQG